MQHALCLNTNSFNHLNIGEWRSKSRILEKNQSELHSKINLHLYWISTLHTGKILLSCSEKITRALSAEIYQWMSPASHTRVQGTRPSSSHEIAVWPRPKIRHLSTTRLPPTKTRKMSWWSRRSLGVLIFHDLWLHLWPGSFFVSLQIQAVEMFLNLKSFPHEMMRHVLE